jgi:hypothetical protein
VEHAVETCGDFKEAEVPGWAGQHHVELLVTGDLRRSAPASGDLWRMRKSLKDAHPQAVVAVSNAGSSDTKRGIWYWASSSIHVRMRSLLRFRAPGLLKWNWSNRLEFMRLIEMAFTAVMLRLMRWPCAPNAGICVAVVTEDSEKEG